MEKSFFSRPIRGTVADAEQATWVGLCHRVADPAVAQVVIDYLASDPELRRQHLGLYLRATESVRKRKEIQERAERIGSLVRAAVRIVVLGSASMVGRFFVVMRAIAFASLPDIPAGTVKLEPAKHRVRKLVRVDPAIAS